MKPYIYKPRYYCGRCGSLNYVPREVKKISYQPGYVTYNQPMYLTYRPVYDDSYVYTKKTKKKTKITWRKK